MEDIYGVVFNVERPYPQSCTYSMKYSWLTEPPTLETLQSAVKGSIESIPYLDPETKTTIHGCTKVLFSKNVSNPRYYLRFCPQ
jgi:hypothetical protein